MILVAGLTPAWQQILSFDSFRHGEVNRAHESHWCASGKVLNVGLALARLGVPACTLSPVGGWSREPIEEQFQAAGARAEWIVTSAPTRVCTTILDPSRNETTELVENAAALSAAELSLYASRFRTLAAEAAQSERGVIVYTGSLPKGTPPTIVSELLADVKLPAVLDIRGAELRAALPCRPKLVKPNAEELSHTVGRELNDELEVIVAAQELIALGAESVLISRGQQPALLVTAERTWRLTPARNEPVVNPIGCGDCLTAGIAWGLDMGRTLVESVRLGMGAASDNLIDLRPACLDRARVERLAESVVVE